MPQQKTQRGAALDQLLLQTFDFPRDQHRLAGDDAGFAHPLIAGVRNQIRYASCTQCVRDVRRALGDNRQHLLETVPRRGYIFDAKVTNERPQTLAEATGSIAVLPFQNMSGDTVTSGPAVEAKALSTLALPDKPSLAVLPFQNMSGDPEQEYFSDRMVEEIITALSCVSGLFVIARNSSFTYKGQATDIKRVGCELGVQYMLDGSVRKAGNRVRITGQLIEPA